MTNNLLLIRRFAGWSGIIGFLAFLIALPLYFIDANLAAPLDQTLKFTNYITRTNTLILVRATLADSLIMVGLIIFLGGFRSLIKQTKQDFEWIATLIFGVGIIVIVIELVGDGLQAGAALDTVVNANPMIVRGLTEASFPMYGAIGLIMSALLLALSGYAILKTKILHKWVGWFAFVAASINILAAPSILGGTNVLGFYTASGYAPFIGQAVLLIWFFCASISMVTKRDV